MMTNRSRTPRQAGQATPTAEQWAQEFERTRHREPTMAEYQAALAAGEIAAERKLPDPSLQQMGAGVKQFAAGAKGLYEARVAPAVERSGAKEFYSEMVAPAARSAASSAKKAMDEHDQRTLAGQTGAKGWAARAPYLIPAAAFGAIFSLFLPIASGMGLSFNYFSEPVRGEGVLLLLVMLATIGLSIAAIVRSARGLRLASGVAGILAGMVGMVDGFGSMFSISDSTGTAVGFGLVLLSALSVILTVAGGLVITTLRRSGNQPQPPTTD